MVIPSRDGRALLERLLPQLCQQLDGSAHQIVVVDNGSTDGTAAWLAAEYPQVECMVSSDPLAFAVAVNRGAQRAKHTHLCLLNNDMVVEPGYFEPLRDAFTRLPHLFCATSQIFLPPGVRREETGKANMKPYWVALPPDDFPLTCDLPVEGESGSFVLYGSGGCSLFDTAKWRELGGLDERYVPAYVEDLDLGFRAWRRGWPSVYVAESRVQHDHRATTSRFYSADDLERILQLNYFRFLAQCVGDPDRFAVLWQQASVRLARQATQGSRAAREALLQTLGLALVRLESSPAVLDDDTIFAIGSGCAIRFPGHGSGTLIANERSPNQSSDSYAELWVVSEPIARAALERVLAL